MRSVVLVWLVACAAPGPASQADLDADGWTSADGDCDEGNPLVHPGAAEHCDGVDEDCDGSVDEDAVDGVFWGVDADEDGAGRTDEGQIACEAPSGHADAIGDCDDDDPDVRPGIEEDWFDGVDTDCDGVMESDGPVDADWTGEVRPRVEFERALDQPIALRVVAVEDAATMNVHIAMPQPMTVLLTSERGVDWVVTEEWPGVVYEVVLTSAAATAQVPDGVLVRRVTGIPDVGDYNDPATREFEEVVEDVFDRPITSMHTAPHASGVGLVPGELHPSEVYADCSGYSYDEPVDMDVVVPDASVFDGVCAGVVSQDRWCLTATWDTQQLALLGLDDPETCMLDADMPTDVSHHEHSVAWVGDHLYFCPNDSNLTRVSLVTGVIEYSNRPCRGVGIVGDRLVLLDADYVLRAFGSWEDVRCGLAREWWVLPDGYFTRVGDGPGGRLVTAWHAGPDVRVSSLPGEEPAVDYVVDLEGHDNWFDGISSVGGDLAVITRASVGVGLRTQFSTFNASGNRRDSMLFDGYFIGLSCVADE